MPNPPTLKDLLEEGLCLLAHLRGGAWPREAQAFQSRLDQLLAAFEAAARSLGKPPGAVEEAKYAFCALADEVLLAADSPLRDAWERAPLQLRHFGEHLAGEGFYRRLDALRRDPRPALESLEVYHACLLAGFQGKYLLEAPGKVQFLADRVGQDLDRVRGPAPALAPHARPAFVHPGGRRDVPAWGLCALSGIAALTLFLALKFALFAELRLVDAGPVRAGRP